MKKVQRKTLLIITAALGITLILYSLFRHFTGIGLGEKLERYFIDIVVFGALGLFMYNRKLASDEKKAKAAEEEARKAAEERAASPEPEEPEEGDEDRPHWERRRGTAEENPGGEG